MSDLLEAPRALSAPSAPPETDVAVTILLATFDGGAFLGEQLASLAAQTSADWTLLWRDDGSSDNSVAILEAFARDHPGRVRRVAGPGGRIGVAASYHALAVAAPADSHLAFCDQDDVWLPEKTARALAALRALPPTRPALYCSRQVLVDARLDRLGTSIALPRRPGMAADFGLALAGNLATGCTIVLNPAAAALFRAAPPPEGALHDWWSYLLVTGAGGAVIADPEPTLLYRQHGGNLVGAPQTRWRRARAALRRGPGAFMAVFRGHLAALAARPDLLSPRAAGMVSELHRAMAGPWPGRLRAVHRHGLRRQTWLESTLFVVWTLIG